MKSIFLVRKDKNCNGENPEWIHMTAKEFFEFKQKPENSERKFVQVEDKNLSSKYSVIFIEANKELYKKCNAEHSEDMRRKEEKKKSTSDYVIANQDGEPLSYTQFKRLWQYIVTRTAKPRIARKLVDGKYVKYMLYPKLGEKARNNGHVVYSLDFDVTPHMLRHTYITNLIHASVDPKTVQYLAGHESSKITMDIYAKVKYNKPEQLAGVLSGAFAEWDGGEYEAAQS